MDACRTGGLNVAWRDESELPFDIEGAITLADQVQIDPLAVLDALLADFAAHGGILMEQTLARNCTDCPDVPPAEGEGVVGRGRAGKPKAVSTVDGSPAASRPCAPIWAVW